MNKESPILFLEDLTDGTPESQLILIDLMLDDHTGLIHMDQKDLEDIKSDLLFEIEMLGRKTW